MPNPESTALPDMIALPDIPALCLHQGELAVYHPSSGALDTYKANTHKLQPELKAALVCNAPLIRQRANLPSLVCFDALELFAFCRPATFCVPTMKGLAESFQLEPPQSAEDAALLLPDIAGMLLRALQNDPYSEKADPLAVARVMGQQGKGWCWTPFVFQALGATYDPSEIIHSKGDLNVWRKLPEWSELAPESPPGHHPVTGEEVKSRLAEILRVKGQAESRHTQVDYARAMTHAFKPIETSEDGDTRHPNTLLAEAGTGIGKTLGYLAPASVWAEKNKGAVWISTYTKNLQRQLTTELDSLYPDPHVKRAKTAVRKGRENYLCLLNLEEKAAGAALAKLPEQAIAAGLMTRWVAATEDGDLTGADFPGWLKSLLGFAATKGLADRRGECIYSACDHYRKCFVERAIRKTAHARIVIANHALVMTQSWLAGPNDDLPQRYVFDEGHHLFQAADSTFAVHLSALETLELRRWLLGAEGGRSNSRARGLQRRIEDLTAGDGQAVALVQAIQHHARLLTAPGWSKRLESGMPQGATETFLQRCLLQVTSRAAHQDKPYSIESDLYPLDDDIQEAAAILQKALAELKRPLTALIKLFEDRLNADKGEMESDTRKRLEALCTSIDRRCRLNLEGWINLLGDVIEGKKSDKLVDWLAVERMDGRMFDVGLYRHWINPMEPFARGLNRHAHGVAVTSATLRDPRRDDEEGWQSARDITGSDFLTGAPVLEAFPSPFNYAAQTKILVLEDVPKTAAEPVASALETLMIAAGGGGLGLFTAINRMRAVHRLLEPALTTAHIPLYAQHIDVIDPGTLVDIFRDEDNACLLGTDALRDGVDVPGRSLRLVVLDRVPWPRPDILHKARRKAFGGRAYDSQIARMRLKQAYGRLIRREEDKGVFVLLDSMLPSELHSAFPEGVSIERVGLKDAVQITRTFLA